jgi:hypothetical protein
VTIPYPAALNAIRLQSTAQLSRAFDNLTVNEMVELGTFVGPARLRAVTAVSQGVTAAVLAETNKRAFNVAFTPIPGQAQLAVLPSRTSEQVRLAILDVGRRRSVAPLLSMPIDVTGTLPSPRSIPPPLADADYEGAARRQRLEVAAIKAVGMVESAGAGFDSQGRPKILFEAHHFGPRTQNRFATTHPHLSLTAREWRGSRRYYGWDQYQRLQEALLLDIDAALMAASWGKFQIMGFNHNGWQDVRSFVRAMYQSEGNHLQAFEAYCNDNHLMAFIRAKDWLAFARGYNGIGQEGYDRRMRDAYSNLTRRLRRQGP